MHPLLQLLVTRPGLLVDHAEGYAELFGSQVASATAAWKQRVLLLAAGLGCLGVAVVLAGVAVMLCATAPPLSTAALWVLVATPLVPAALGLGCLFGARHSAQADAFGNLRQQARADLALLREVMAS